LMNSRWESTGGGYATGATLPFTATGVSSPSWPSRPR
jgi:hypothetical protein